MTTADYLHATATLMRERARRSLSDIPGEPWVAGPTIDPDNHGWVVSCNIPEADWDTTVARLPYDYDGVTAYHLAGMHPYVALAVADWLDQWADHMALHAEDVADGLRPEVCPRCDAGNDYDHVCNDAALAVCRAYNPEGESR